MSIRAMVPGHWFMSESNTRRNGLIVNEAKCECGHPLTWATRDDDHARHLLAVVWADGFQDGKRQDAEGDDGPRFVNPWEDSDE